MNLQQNLNSALTVRELIEELELMNPDAKVVFAHASGDYWRTVVAPTVQTAELGLVKWNAYHDCAAVVDGEGDDEEEENDGTEVVILR